MSVQHLRQLFSHNIVSRLPLSFSVRPYAGWAHRKPSLVVLPFEPTAKVNLKKEKVIDLKLNEIDSIETSNVNEPKNQEKVERPVNEVELKSKFPSEKSKEILSKREEKLKKRKFYLSQQKVFDDNHEIIFTKLKENDGRISTLLTNLKSKKERIRTRQVFVEGWRLIVDGLEAKCNLKYVIFSRVDDLNNIRPYLPKTGVKFYKIPYKEIEMWSDVETAPGIIGVFEMPSSSDINRLSKPLPLDLVCDNIRLPGNLGAILRAAVGAGVDKVLLTKGCVDMWDPKVLRSAAGAHFSLPIHNSVDWEKLPKHLDPYTSVFIADSNAIVASEENDEKEGYQLPVLPYYAVEYASLEHITLVIGGETHGISDESYRLAANKNGVRLNIPLQKGVDSLNSGMAAAVIALEIRKQFLIAFSKQNIKAIAN